MDRIAAAFGPFEPFVRRHAVGIVGAVVALSVVAPLLAPGFTLVYDMVFVPRPHWSAALLGISPTYPRAVPTQALIDAASAVVPAAVVQKAILLFVFGGSVVGAARLVEGGSVPARVAAGVLYAWNPMTFERLLLGQWAVLLGYALLPWAVAAARSFRRRAPGSTGRLVLALAALTAATPYLGIVGGATALAVALWPPRDRPPEARGSGGDGRRALMLLGGAVGVSLVWLIPTILHPSVPDHAGLSVDLFAARADAPVGTLGSLVSLGGVWRADLAPPGRSTLVWVPAFALILGLGAFGLRRMGGGWSRGARRGIVAAAAIGLLVAIAPRVPGLHGAVVWWVRTVPGGGLLRDSQKFAIPLALLEAVAFGFGVQRIVERFGRGDRAARALGLALAALPIALAPTLAWGAGGRLHTASYPASWSAVQRVTSEDPAPGGILVLPWHAYVPFGWNHEQTVHQPAPLFFGRPVVAATRLEFGTIALPGEDPWSRSADPVAAGRGPLASGLPGLGVRYVMLCKEGDWKASSARLVGLDRVLDAPDLALYRGSYAGPVPSFPEPPAGAVIGGDVVALAVVVSATVAAGRTRRRQG